MRLFLHNQTVCTRDTLFTTETYINLFPNRHLLLIYLLHLINFSGTHCAAWFDILNYTNFRLEDEAGVKNSHHVINELIEKEISTGIEASRIMLGGMSLGGAQAIYTTLKSKHTLGGLVAFSTFLPLRTEFCSFLPHLAHEFGVPTDCPPLSNSGVPCLQVHGDLDAIVPLEFLGRPTSVVLDKLFTDFKFKVYKGLNHATSSEELVYVKAFINKHLPGNK